MSAKKLLQPLAAQLHASFSASGRPYAHQHIHQLLHAAIGSVSPEVDSQDNLPIQVCRDSDRQYNLYETIERAKKCLGLTDLQAVGVAEEVIEVLRAAGIGVNQVRLLLDPSFTSKTRKKAFKALCKNLDLNELGDRFVPKTATLAIAAGMAPPPKITWKDRFALAADFPIRGQSQLVEMVTRSECYLWVFPPTDHQATASVRRVTTAISVNRPIRALRWAWGSLSSIPDRPALNFRCSPNSRKRPSSSIHFRRRCGSGAHKVTPGGWETSCAPRSLTGLLGITSP